MQPHSPRLDFRTLTLFAGLNDQALAALARIARYYTLRAGETLFSQGDQARSMYVVVEGGVRLVEHTTEGKDVNLKIYGPDDVFGLLAISGEFPHYAEIVAVQDSELVGFAGEAMRRVMLEYSSIALQIIDVLVTHVHQAHSRVRQMAVEKTERRLARALLHFCQKFGQVDGDGQPIVCSLTQQDIAEFTGTTVETVNRQLRVWEEAGYVERQWRQIIILDRIAMRQIASHDGEMGMGYLVE